MQNFEKYLAPDRDGFAKDPLGYSALASQKWEIARTVAGFPADVTYPLINDELKDPILWLSQAHAMSQAAVSVITSEQSFEDMPSLVRGICDSQYCAVSLMLIGYSLEISLKAMIIFSSGAEGYRKIEQKTRHHRLQELASFIPSLSKKDKAILRGLSEFIHWAGRYPDPGSGKEANLEDIFSLSERYKISAKDLFNLSSKVMAYATELVSS